MTRGTLNFFSSMEVMMTHYAHMLAFVSIVWEYIYKKNMCHNLNFYLKKIKNKKINKNK